MSILPTDSFANLGADPIGAAWRMAWTPPDRRPIWEWAATNVNLQGQYVNKGLFSIADSRHLELPFRYALNDEVRQLNILKAVQTFGTGIADIHFQYVFAESPGPCMWTLQTDDDAEQHYLTRVKPTLESSPLPRVIDLVRRLHKKRDLYQFNQLAFTAPPLSNFNPTATATAGAPRRSGIEVIRGNQITQQTP